MDFKEQRLFTHGYQRMCMVLYRAKGGLWGHRQGELPARDCGGRCIPWPCAPGRSSSAQGPCQVRDTCLTLLWTPGNPVKTCSLAIGMPHESRQKRVQHALWPGAILRTMTQAAAHLCNLVHELCCLNGVCGPLQLPQQHCVLLPGCKEAQQRRYCSAIPRQRRCWRCRGTAARAACPASAACTRHTYHSSR